MMWGPYEKARKALHNATGETYNRSEGRQTGAPLQSTHQKVSTSSGHPSDARKAAPCKTGSADTVKGRPWSASRKARRASALALRRETATPAAAAAAEAAAVSVRGRKKSVVDQKADSQGGGEERSGCGGGGGKKKRTEGGGKGRNVKGRRTTRAAREGEEEHKGARVCGPGQEESGIALAQPPPTARVGHRSPVESTGCPSCTHQYTSTAPCAGAGVQGNTGSSRASMRESSKKRSWAAAGCQGHIAERGSRTTARPPPALRRAYHPPWPGRAKKPARSGRRGDLLFHLMASADRRRQATTLGAELDNQHEAQHESKRHQRSSSSKQSQKHPHSSDRYVH